MLTVVKALPFYHTGPEPCGSKTGPLHQGAWPDSCAARPQQHDVTRVIAVTGAEGRGGGEGGRVVQPAVWCGVRRAKVHRGRLS